MKCRLNAVQLLAMAAIFATGALADDLADLANEARRAYIRGDFAGAKEKFEMIRRVDPGNRAAYSYLRRIAADETALKAGKVPPNATQATLARLVLDKVDFRDASLAEVLDFLRQKAGQRGEKLPVNFVQNLDETARNAKVTMTLQNVPFTEVLRYIGELAGVQFVYEPYAIIVKLKGAAPMPGINLAPAPRQAGAAGQ